METLGWAARFAAGGTLLVSTVVAPLAQATSYACNNGETLQQCMEREKREAARRPSAPTYPRQPAHNPAPQRPVYNQTPAPATGSGGAACNWLSAVQYARVSNAHRGTRCGTRDSIELKVTNVASEPIKVVVYLQETNGRWQKNADGTFDTGLGPGRDMGFYTCHATGSYKVIAMPARSFRAGKCSYPDYNGH